MNLPPAPHHHTLNAALGWLELGLPADAQAELDRLPAELRTHPLALETQFALCAHLADWAAAFVVAETQVRLHPEEVGGWIHRAYAARRKPGGGLAEAFALLWPAFEHFPDEPIIPYNLACYRARQGDVEAAWDWLTEAMKVGDPARLRRMALADEDLEALRPRLMSVAAK